MNNLQQSSQRLRVQCSLAWLRGVCIDTDKLLDAPFLLSGGLKPEVIGLLTNTAYYFQVYCAIFPSESLQTGSRDDEENLTCTFWPLIHGLARHGVYAVEEGGCTVNHAALAQRNPFRESSHLAILDALMTAYVASVVTIPRVVRAVRQIFTLNAAHELPSTLEEALLLWLRKVAESVTRAHQQEKALMLQEPDARQRRRNRVQLLQSRELIVARPRGLEEAVAGGQCLAALLVCYCHIEFSFQDFHFKPTELAREEAIHNLTKVASFSHSTISPHSFHIDPDVLVNKENVSVLGINLLALLARLFNYFEPVNGSKGNTSESVTPCHRDVSYRTRTLELTPLSCGQQEPSCSQLSIERTGNPTKSTPRYECKRLLPRRQKDSDLMSSYSAASLTREQHSSEYAASAHNASHSSSSIDLGEKTQNSVIFNPATITTNSMKKYTTGGMLSSASAPQITANVGNQGIREQMKNMKATEANGIVRREKGLVAREGVRRGKGKEQKRRRWTPGCPVVVYPSSHQTDTPPTSNHSEITNTYTSSDRKPNMPPPFCFQQNQTALAVEVSSPLSTLEVHKSFTLDKQHTVASASKAGLPIITGGLPIITDGLSVVESTERLCHGNMTNRSIDVGRKEPSEKGGERLEGKATQNDQNTCIPEVTQIRAESRTSTQPQPSTRPNYRCIVVFTPEDISEEQVEFDQYLMQRVPSEIEYSDHREDLYYRLQGHCVSEFIKICQRRLPNMVSCEREVKQRQQDWRQRLKEIRTMSQSESNRKSLTNSAVTTAPALMQQPVVLTSTTSKKQETVTSMPPPNDPLTDLPLTPIPAGFNSALLQPTNTPIYNTQPEGKIIPGNPWLSGGYTETLTPTTPQKVMATGDLQARRQQLLKQKLERRQHDRKMEKQKRAIIIRDIRTLTENNSSITSAASDKPSAKLSSHPSSPLQTFSSPRSTPFLTHNGPNCYVKPSAKSNRKIIRNALCHVCLAGDVNLSAKKLAISELDNSNALHFFILFKHVISFTFRALYSYSPVEGKTTKIFGSGPRTVQEHMVDHFYKYNSGSKEFLKIHSRSFSLSVDAFTLKQEVWASRRSKHSAV